VRACVDVRESVRVCVCERVCVSFGPFSCLLVSFHICIGLFSYIQVSLHKCRSRERVRESVCARERLCFLVSFHVCRSLFIYAYVTFHLYRSLFICVGLFSYV